MTPNLLKRFIDSNNYDIRRTNNARWIDQKCAFDSICFVADCIIEYYRNQNMDTFFSPNIWKSEYAIKNVQLWFGKPDPLDISTMDEYNKFFRQPMKLLAAAGILSEKNIGKAIEFKISNLPVLEYIALRERNSNEFLCIYIEKTLKDSGLWDAFESFFDEQTELSLQQLKKKFSEFCIKHTPINTAIEANRIFIKVLNPLACKEHKKGTIKGKLSNSIITFDKISYNQPNWRDVITGKDKNVSRGNFNPQVKEEQLYSYKISRAAKNLKRFNDKFNNGKSEIVDRFSIGERATHMHHIFPKNAFPTIADYIENLIALTSGQHLQKAHPNGNTSEIDLDYQYLCLLGKTENIRKNLFEEAGDPIIYNFSDFMYVLDTGLNTDYFSHLSENDFNSVVSGIEINYS
ncbi:restriction endonuclease [Vibrio parahaemolyticus]|uniref:hypothetical protein n=1 Tax=Vibrio parahaemolyticus TaxID=670 RepID=UPI0006A71A24|nr:hypothetical protein [Vibrio parahaemolyticus]EGQ7867569.1 restriction endonuclease [Vibrio parahaemolyticus]EGQ7885166.1 restriction endonuclease [Vibrio parahaemolyticus]EGQ9372429.1 restriction endonuclease [Vibrio parahaemolyticus]EGQ9422249.1 restriction endonuclease [Vibrio parahaemolyticus]EGQ9427500.1 restriction endonuclease [Vibrio parahaemolyticus]